MLDQIDLDRAIDKPEYKAEIRALQNQLYNLQQQLFEARRPALIVFEGWAGTSKIGTIGILTRRLDPRGLRVHPITSARTFETKYPWLYRFWQKIPAYGQLALFDRSWYREVIAERTRKKCSAEEWRKHCEDIVEFERQLADDGAVILKFWLHISRKEQARRFAKLEGDPLTAWQLTSDDRWQNQHYRRVNNAVEDLIVRTDTPFAPWVALPATNKRALRIDVFTTLLNTLSATLGTPVSAGNGVLDGSYDDSGMSFRREKGLLQGSSTNGHGHTMPAIAAATQVEPPKPATTLHKIDLSVKLDEKEYERELKELQAKIHMLGFQMYQKDRPVVLVFEGWDAAGKGGVIKRLTEKLDPRGYVVHAIAAPSGEDKDRHYLYRFWRRLPPCGNMAIFDRSWYGRLLVERVEGFARPDEWQRAFGEINTFESQLLSFGTVIAKFWMHISPEEQLRRFEERQNTAYKAWKLTDEDWRNREKWSLYEDAADEMLLRTSTPAAPWTVVEAEDKRYARIKVLRTVVRRLEDDLGSVKL